MAHFINSLLEFVAEHSALTYVVVFLICFLESLVLVGLIIPGSVLLVGLGAMLATGVMSWAITLSVAIVGAILGDFASFWLGSYYQQQIEQRWPFRKFPKLLDRGREFFKRHGGKSVFLGRFIHVVRPMVPLVAGMMNMSQWRFFVFNALSAIGWVGIYLVPGFLLGGSLISNESVAVRLNYLIGMLALLLWLTIWLISKAFKWLSLLERKSRGLILKLSTLFFLSVWLFFCLTRNQIPWMALNQADLEVYRFFSRLRTHLGDQILIAVTELGDTHVNVMVIAVVLFILLKHAKWRAAGYWALTAIGGYLLIELFRWVFQTARPIDIYDGLARFSFPSGHATMSAVLYGFLAIILMRCFSPRFRWLPLSMALGFSLMISFSRIYLGAHWLTDIIGGWSLGWTWLTLMGILYFQKADELPKNSILVGVLLALVLGGSWHIFTHHAEDVKKYQKAPNDI